MPWSACTQDLPLPDKAPYQSHQGTGPLERAGDAAYMLSALQATGIAAPWLPRNDTAAVAAMHAAAQTGSLIASNVLMDRYLYGRGVPQSCAEGLRCAGQSVTARQAGSGACKLE